MAKKKNSTVETEEIVLDANAAPATPTLKVVEPTSSKGNSPALKVVEPKKDDPMVVVKDEIKELRPTDVYGPDEETAAEMGDRLQKKADDYKVELEGINDVNELKELEQEWIKNLEIMDEYLKKVAYILPKSVEFNHKTYPKSYVAGRITKFIQTKEVKFQFTLGMWEMCKLWISQPDELNYSEYNSTIETLGSLTFKGMTDWENILIINEFFRMTNREYAKDITAYQYLSTMHSHVVARMQLLEPVEDKSKKVEPKLQPEKVNVTKKTKAKSKK